MHPRVDDEATFVFLMEVDMGMKRVMTATVCLALGFTMMFTTGYTGGIAMKDEGSAADTVSTSAAAASTSASSASMSAAAASSVAASADAGSVASRGQGSLDLAVFLSDTVADGGNAIYSPLSLDYCLGMLEAGADGATLTQLEAFLGRDDDAMAAFAKEGIAAARKVGCANIADSIWIRKGGVAISSDYSKRMEDIYDADVSTIDFSNPATAAGTINSWVADKTARKIDGIVSENTFEGSDPQMILVNAVYFKDEWSTPFDADSTFEDGFTPADGKKIAVDMMHGVADNYFETGNLVGAVKCYTSGYCLIAAREAGDRAIDLDDVDVPSILAAASVETDYDDVYLDMPKVHIETTLPLGDTLKAEGIADAFDAATADFSKMCDGSAEGLCVSDVLQKAYVDIDEEGTEAAAATGITMTVTSAPIEEKRTSVTVNLDRPYLFLIVDESGNVMFAGVVEDPSK